MARAHDHDACIANALSEAARVCAARGAQLTELRRRVLQLVWSSHRSVKAYDLLEKLGEAGRSAKPPTVYRALEFLIEQGLVHRVDSLNAFVGCPNPERRHEGQFLICTACGQVDELDATAIRDAVAGQAAAAGFAAHRQKVEVHGLCAVCRAA